MIRASKVRKESDGNQLVVQLNWLEHFADTEEVLGSIPNITTKLGTTGKVPSSSVKAYWVGSIPTGPTNKETTPELVSAYPDSREVKLLDGCVTPWTIMT